ncbi:hypothetical protein [Paenibacillus sp. MBLB4367]|uniref:hypothetical protein n=1 Tax=Paenibacillus sp. MBLB4367 TaxID=3384767 RepID=UPI003908247F
MREVLGRFTTGYAADMEKHTDSGDEQRSVNNPVMFLFIGDKAKAAVSAVSDMVERKWSNSAGVMYVHVYANEPADKANAVRFQVDGGGTDRKRWRQELHASFCRDDRKLMELNRTLRAVSSKLSEFGRLYASFQRINVSVVTCADDPCNVLVPEITLLTKAILGASFRIVQVDLYALIKEKTGGEEFGFSSSVSVGFLRELNYFQNDRYRYEGMLQVTEDGIRLPVEHAGPLFDLAYLLSDKNERGVIAERSMEENFEIICSINLLKNREMLTDYTEKNDIYNNMQFKQNIMSDFGAPTFATAGFSKIKRPNKAIAATVVHQAFRKITRKLKASASVDMRQVVDKFGLSPAAFERKVNGLMPDDRRIEEMCSLMMQKVSYDEIRTGTVREAELKLYGNSAEAFFEKNVAVPSREQLASYRAIEEIRAGVGHIVADPLYGLYCAFDWMEEKNGDSNLFEEIRKAMKEINRQLEAVRDELESLYQGQVEHQPYARSRLPFQGKANLAQFTRYFFQEVYGRKYRIVHLDLSLKVLQAMETALEDVHRELRTKVEEMADVERCLSDYGQLSIREAEEELGKNIELYYGKVVDEGMAELEARRGGLFYFEDRYIGNVFERLEQGKAALLERFIQFCSKEILSSAPFRLSFEDELLQRANVTARYEHRDVLTKEELFGELYAALEEQAVIHLEVYNYTHKNRYEEKYIFGDFYSEFVTYAFQFDEGRRGYKLGCVHEKRSSGIEKLNMMGGFQINDLLYVINNKKYYQSYLDNGFCLHGIAESELPDL